MAVWMIVHKVGRIRPRRTGILKEEKGSWIS